MMACFAMFARRCFRRSSKRRWRCQQRSMATSPRGPRRCLVEEQRGRRSRGTFDHDDDDDVLYDVVRMREWL